MRCWQQSRNRLCQSDTRDKTQLRGERHRRGVNQQKARSEIALRRLPDPTLSSTPFGLFPSRDPERPTLAIARTAHGFIIRGINRREPFDPRR